MKRAALAAAAVALLWAAPSRARTPEIATDPRDGVWIAQDDKFIFATIDRWSVFSAGATVNKLVVDQSILWIATDDGVIRFDIGSQKSTKLTMDDGLPSQRVSTVAFDDQYVWFGTNKGLVRYRKIDRVLKIYDESNGLPSKTVTYSVTIGRQVWFGTRAGIAYYSPDVDGLRAFGEADGLASGDIAELFQFGQDLWCRTDVGLSRFRIQQRVFNNFPMTLMGAQQIRLMTVDGENMWVGTDNGLWQFQGASDSVRIFPQQDALGSKMLLGVEPGATYNYITTDKEVLQYNKLNLAIRRFSAAEGLFRQEGSTGTLSTGKFIVVMFPDGAMIFNITLDQWVYRPIAITANSEKKTTARLFGQLELDQPYLGSARDKENSYATAIGGAGFGRQLDKDRSLNGSVYLDYGQLNVGGIQDLQYKIEYLGNQNDRVREVRIEDKLKYRYLEEGLDRQLLVQGAHTQLATPGAEPKAKLDVEAGFRRGQVVRDYLTGPRRDAYQLSQKYILPGTDRVYVDGELLNNGTDYMIVYPTGQLQFLNPERVDDLSVITVEYERDLMPKKDLGTLSLQRRLPASNEIGGWVLSGTPTLVSTDSALYNQIDGGAPKYIDLGWVAGVYATYQQSSGSIQVSIHNMGTPENAQLIFDRYLPSSRIEISSIPDPANPKATIPNAVVDMGLATSYAATGFVGQYFIEVSVDDRSDAALVYVKTFTLQILNREKLVTSNLGDAFKEVLVAARGAVSPVSGMELGARVVQLQQMSGTSYTDAQTNLPAETSAAHLTSGVLDGRYQTKVGETGLLTSYLELGGSHDSTSTRPDGMAGMGFVRLSSQRLEGMVSGRLNTQNWTPIGHTSPTAPDASGDTRRTWNDARLGTLRDEAQLNATAYPYAWLPVTALFTRQRAWLPDGADGTGALQHAIARVQLNKAGLPATTLQVASTEFDNPDRYQVHRLQGSAQTDYDLAQALSFTRIKRFNVRALYSLSQAETDQRGAYAFADRVRLVRLEGKLSPTTTESIYALFRSREVSRQADRDGPYGRSISHWELLSGAQSNIIPGIVPKLNYNLFYDDCRVQSGCVPSDSGASTTGTTTTSSGDTSGLWSNTGANGSANQAFGPGQLVLTGPTRTVTGSVGGTLGIYPGQWWAKLGPLAFVPGVTVSDGEASVEGVKTQYNRTYDYVSTEVWGGRRLEVTLYQRYRYSNDGETAAMTANMTQLQNRIVYRPIFTSPIMLLSNFQRDRALNDATSLSAGAGPWRDKQSLNNTLEWLMRWNQLITTRARLKGNFERTEDTFLVDPSNAGILLPANHTKYTYGGEVQVRLYPLEDVSALYIYDSVEWRQVDMTGDQAQTAWEILPAFGVIWRLGDKLYLDGHFFVDHFHCISGATCLSSTKLDPYVFLTMNL